MNQVNSVNFLNQSDIEEILAGREREVLAVVEEAYHLHERGETALPHSSFLRFPRRASDRIIALPGYLGGRFNVAGLKWIASFPSNIERGLPRATATLLLNSLETGLVHTVMEGSIISAQRTAASAALGAHALLTSPVSTLGIIGCGPINQELVRFCRTTVSSINRVVLFDKNVARAKEFARNLSCEVALADEIDSVWRNCKLVSIATNAITPHIDKLPPDSKTEVILHLSLRDLSVRIIEKAFNMVDDVDHACRADTSVHLVEKASGNRDHIHGTLAGVISGVVSLPKDSLKIFSPFGLGVLDLAVAHLVLTHADSRGRRVDDFVRIEELNSSERPFA